MISLDTNVVSETLRKSPDPAVVAWLVRFDAELALPTVTIAEMAFGIAKFQPDQRATRLEQGLAMSAPDAMIAAIARVNGGRLATRNLTDFRTTGLELTSPWEF